MKLYLLVLSMLLSMLGCSSQQRIPDFFAAQDQFAANRVLQTTSVEEIEYETLLAHVVDSLLDLDCTLQETNKQFGLISATGARPRYQGNLMNYQYWAGCAGHKVTVKVTASAPGHFDVRATFMPPAPEANRVFQLLLERSIAQTRVSEAS